MKKQLSLLSVFILMLTFLFIPHVQAESGTTYIVGNDGLNVRSSPSSSASVIGTLNKGDKVTVFQDKHGWKQTYYNGQTAWVAGQYLMKSSNQSSPKKKAEVKQTSTTVYVAEQGVRLRSGPGTNYQITGFTDKGDKLQVLQSQGDWKQVKTDNGKVAWIAGWLTSSSSSQAKTRSQQTSSNQLNGKNIVLDAGHGGYDPGSTALNGQFEKDLVLNITKQIGQVLESHGATVVYTRTNDKYVSLFDRVRVSNAYWTDAFISIHLNAFTSNQINGVSTHYFDGNNDAKLAQSIQNALMDELSLNDRGVQKDNYYVLRENRDLSVLLELGFITNQNDLNTITSSDYGTQVGNALAKGLANYFN